MQRTTRKKAPAYEANLKVDKYLGRNSWGSHSALSADESRELVNWDIFVGPGGDYLRSRRGSRFWRGEAPTKRDSTAIKNAITWDIGEGEYSITQEGTSFYAQPLLTPDNPVRILAVGGGDLSVAYSTQAEMFISGDKLYVIHPGGNKIIEWNEVTSLFEGYTAGMTYPFISSIATANAGVITGSYTLGIEKVYQVGGKDRMASTPNRNSTARIIAVTGTIASKKIKVTIQAFELDSDSLWTHVRFYRSKNKNTDVTDPNNPIDGQGTDDELYEEALITRAEMGLASLSSIAVSDELPVGNAGTQAGKPAGIYTIEVNNADSVFLILVGLDEIELLPIAAASVGCFHAKRIFVSGINDERLDDRSRNNIYYSNLSGSKYASQYNPLNFIDTGRDGQKMTKLLSFEKDLIGIKESKTGRLPSGNVDFAFEILDQGIGVSDKNFATFIPAVGIAAITNDYKDFRIFGYDLRWTKDAVSFDISTPVRAERQALDISIPIRAETAAMDAETVSFAYANGKVLISDGTGVFYALHQKEKRGWTKYEFMMNGVVGRVFTFANGTRVGVVSPSTYLMEIEVEGLDADDNSNDDSLGNLFTLSETGYRFQSGEGAHILEHNYLAIEASLSAVMTAAPYLNGLAWPLTSLETETELTPAPTIYNPGSGLQDREYRLYLTPANIGNVLWGRMVGNYLHYVLRTTAPAICRSKRLCCDIDEDGISFGSFDPFQGIGDEPVGPAPTVDLINGGLNNEAITDSIDGGYEDETITSSIDGGYSA